jgi:hypothetical protein
MLAKKIRTKLNSKALSWTSRRLITIRYRTVTLCVLRHNEALLFDKLHQRFVLHLLG